MYRLMIEKSNGHFVTICGQEEVLSAELEEWVRQESDYAEGLSEAAKAGLPYCNADQFRVRKIQGVSDDSTRTDVVVAYRMAEVLGMVLVEL